MKVSKDFQETDKTISNRIMEEQTENWSEQCQSCYGKGCDECNQTGEILYTNENVLSPGIEFTLNYITSQESKQRLFNLMSEQHNLTLLDGEMNEIVCALTKGLIDDCIPHKQGNLPNN